MVSSLDFGQTWEHETTLFFGTDLREPIFLTLNDKLYFSFFQAGTNPIDFEPLGLFRIRMIRVGEWTSPELYGHEGEVVWEIVQENGTAYSQSYSGQYGLPGDGTDLGQLDMFLNMSTDGINWQPVGQEVIYHGGLTEVGFYFDLEGNVWGVARNEDGDESGWGSRTFFASQDDLSSWNFVTEESDPWIYESPKMFRHGSELYLVARTDPEGPFWSKDNPLLNILPAWEHHLADLVSFSLRQHGTGIWHLDRSTGQLSLVLELTGCGDTAFPSIIRYEINIIITMNGIKINADYQDLKMKGIIIIYILNSQFKFHQYHHHYKKYFQNRRLTILCTDHIHHYQKMKHSTCLLQSRKVKIYFSEIKSF